MSDEFEDLRERYYAMMSQLYRERGKAHESETKVSELMLQNAELRNELRRVIELREARVCKICFGRGD